MVGLRNYRGEASIVPVSVPIPADLRAREVQLFVGDADAALRMDEPPGCRHKRWIRCSTASANPVRTGTSA